MCTHTLAHTPIYALWHHRTLTVELIQKRIWSNCQHITTYRGIGWFTIRRTQRAIFLVVTETTRPHRLVFFHNFYFYLAFAWILFIPFWEKLFLFLPFPTSSSDAVVIWPGEQGMLVHSLLGRPQRRLLCYYCYYWSSSLLLFCCLLLPFPPKRWCTKRRRNEMSKYSIVRVSQRERERLREKRRPFSDSSKSDSYSRW